MIPLEYEGILTENRVLHMQGLGFHNMGGGFIARLQTRPNEVQLNRRLEEFGRKAERVWTNSPFEVVADLWRREFSDKHQVGVRLAELFPHSKGSRVPYCRASDEDIEVILDFVTDANSLAVREAARMENYVATAMF